MEPIRQAARVLAHSSSGNPIISTITIILFYFMFSIVEAGTERLVFGESFPHWLDPIFGTLFIAFAAYSVWACAIYNSMERGQ
ncbi:hypothetical protein RSO41_06160 [Halomonas sp. I1]|uniref:hypothetical protein n=1 Tax=Halomonas sp. I1 TaxID=393536 RepID=UPI0028DE8A82|nr:hypothetical protein [Halomonas sp. I1]MDT8894234.1 hypothetical protein [Halomonas sp. I1]